MAVKQVDPLAFLATAELRHQFAAAALIGAMQRRAQDAASAELRLAVAFGQHLTPIERATVSAALWRDLDLLPPAPTIVSLEREASEGAAP